MRNIAIIPARSGSKGLKDKNIKELSGKPLVAYSIEAALESEQFETVMVSTDSPAYADICKRYGASVPFLRSEKNSSDTASSWDMVEEVLLGYQRNGQDFDTFMLLQPTSPLRSADDIREAYRKMNEMEANSIVSLCEVDHSPLQCNVLPSTFSLEGFVRKEVLGKRRQDIPTYYRFNGAIYLAKVKYFMENHDIYRNGSYAYIMNKFRSIDIDDDLDFTMAEVLMSVRFSDKDGG